VPLQPWRARVRALGALIGRSSLSVQYFSDPAMRAAVRSITRTAKPDAAVVYSSTMAQYVPPSLERQTIADIVDVDSEKWRDYSSRSRFPLSAVFRTEARRLAELEAEIANRFPQVLVTTRREAELLATRTRGDRAIAEPLVNGVDLNHFRPDGEARLDAGRNVVFTGAMDYRANIEAVLWFCEQVWPAISGIPARLWIVGSRPTRRIRSLERDPSIVVTGRVADVRPYLQRAAAVVAPLLTARGIQNKVLEGMACGKPVVVSSAVAECMPELPRERAAIVAESAAEFRAALHRVLNDRAYARAVGARARAYVERWHRWPVMLDRFCDIVEATAHQNSVDGAEVCA
jgi:sugar transferase (PEP-CTERM/EpsH1 system associated)